MYERDGSPHPGRTLTTRKSRKKNLPELGTDISSHDAGQKSVILHRTDRDAEGMRTIVLSVRNQASHDNGVVGSLTESSNPPLASSEVWGVELKLVGLGDVGGGGLDALDVRSVSDLSLGIASNDLVAKGTLEEELVLLLSSLGDQGRHEHAAVETEGTRLVDQDISLLELLGGPLFLLSELDEGIVLLEGTGEALGAAQEVAVRLVEGRLVLDEAEELFLAFEVLLAIDVVGQVVNGEGGLGALLGEQVGTLGLGWGKIREAEGRHIMLWFVVGRWYEGEC